MSAAATVVVSSAEGAGDMPSSVPVAGGDSQDDAQPFSEVLSLSSPDHPASSDPAAPPDSSQSPDDAFDQSGTAATTVPEGPAARPAGAPREGAQRRAGPSERGDGHVRRAVGPPPLPAAGKADQIQLPAPTHTLAEGVAVAVDQSLGATHPLATAASSETPRLALPSTPVAASTASSTASGGSAVSAARTEIQGGDDVLSRHALAQDRSGPEPVAGLSAQLPHTPGAGSTSEGVSRNPAPADVTGEGAGEARGVPDRGTGAGSATVRSGPVRIQVNGTTPGAAASALSAATTGSSGTAATSSAEVLEPPEFPDTGGGTTGVDISDLAASISRPLAGGSGDYSVQVSLHPPELGEVRALLSLQGDVLHVTLTPEHPSGFDALSDAMPALHEQLAGGGVEVHVTLGQPGDPEGGDGRAATEAGRAGKAGSDDATPAISASAIPMSTGGPGRIHLVL